jgi:hypothetical protein
MGFKDKTYGLNIFFNYFLVAIELQLQKDFMTIFVFFFHYVSHIVILIII